MLFYGKLINFKNTNEGMLTEYDLCNEFDLTCHLGKRIWILTKDFKPVCETIITGVTKTHIMLRGLDSSTFVGDLAHDFYFSDMEKPDEFIFDNKYITQVSIYNRSKTFGTYQELPQITLNLLYTDDIKLCFNRPWPSEKKMVVPPHHVTMWDMEKYRNMTVQDVNIEMPYREYHSMDGNMRRLEGYGPHLKAEIHCFEYEPKASTQPNIDEITINQMDHLQSPIRKSYDKDCPWQFHPPSV